MFLCELSAFLEVSHLIIKFYNFFIFYFCVCVCATARAMDSTTCKFFLAFPQIPIMVVEESYTTVEKQIVAFFVEMHD